MKKSLLIWGILLGVAFLLLTLRRVAPERSGDTDSRVPSSEARERLSRFWNHYHQATTLRNGGRFEEAAALYRSALDVDPNHEESIYYLGNCLTELGDYREARRIYRRLVEVNPQSRRGWKLLGINLSHSLPGAPGLDYEEAEKAFLENVRINPEESGPFLDLGRLELKRGDREAALRYFRTAADFRSPTGLFLLGLVGLVEGSFEDSADALRRVLETARQEARIAGRGVASEGDVEPGAAAFLAPDSLSAAALSSQMLLSWTQPDFRNEISRARPPLFPLETPGGEDGRWAFADYDLDGDPDAVATGGGAPARLWQNRNGAWRPVPLANGPAFSWSASWGDYDGDGDPDLYITGSGPTGTQPNRLLRNDRAGRFVDVTADSGLTGSRNTIDAVFADLDQDGRLDLLECGADLEAAPAVRFYRGRQAGVFEEISGRAGLSVEGTAVDCDVGDYDADGLPDLLVQQWKRGALLFHNQGKGRFRDATPREISAADSGFSSLFLDYDNDGRLDLLITRHAEYADVARSSLAAGSGGKHCAPRFFRNVGDGVFREASPHPGPRGCYGTLQATASDLDQDGWVDLVLANGSLENDRLEPSAVWLNQAGAGFREAASTSPLGSCRSVSAALPKGREAPIVQLAGCGIFEWRRMPR